MNTQPENHDQKLTLWQELRLGIRTTPRLWLIVLACALVMFSPLRGLVGGLAVWVFLAALVLATLLFVPTFIGAIAGHATGSTWRWCKQQARRIRH